MSSSHLSSGTTPTRSGRPRGAASREQLLDAAVRLFGQQGVAATTLAYIAREVGVTSAMVHYHFANREQLIDAVVAERLMPAIKHIWAPVTPKALQDPVVVLHGMAENIFNSMLAQPWLAPMWLNDIGSSSGELRERVMALLPEDSVTGLSKAISAAQARGEIDARLSAPLMFLTLVGQILLPLASLDACQTLHEDADLSMEAVRLHIASSVDKLLRP